MNRSASKLASIIGAAALTAGAVVTLGVGVAHADSPAGQPGTWQEHKYDFVFMGFTSTYSCDGLADKLRDLLIAAGARKDAKARAGGCASGFGRPDKFARATLTFHTLSPAGPGSTAGTGAASSAGTVGSSGAPPSGASTGDGASGTIIGAWRAVAFANHRPTNLRTGDCELVEQFQHNVLPMFSTQNVVNGTSCVPHQESGSVIDLRFDAFAPVAPAAAAP